ncbi:MAG: GNAT family N-acetyltransferase [Fusobacteriaceae bacterium]|nr:GNAT family N-acetyltransferase [Fusobacteriaceae bacterium]
MKFRFLKIEKTNLEELMEIEKEAFPLCIQENIKVYKERMEVFPEGTYGIWRDEEMIAYISSELWEYKEIYEEERFSLSHSINKYHKINGEELYISSFAIKKKYSSMGYGKIIFEQFLLKMKEAFKIESSILLVSEEWIKAQKIYLTFGYKQLKKIKDFFRNDYEEKFDGIIMRKNMK